MIALLQQVQKHFATPVLMAAPDHTNTILFALKLSVIDSELVMTWIQQLQTDFEMDLMPYVKQFTM